MKQILLIDVAPGTALPPKTIVATAPGQGSLPPTAERQLTDGEMKKASAKRIQAAMRLFPKQLLKSGKISGNAFFMRLVLAFTFIWLKIGNKEAYVDDLLARLEDENKDMDVASKETIQHYEGPMLRWLAELAHQNDPTDPNLQEKFPITFLRSHPQYILALGDGMAKLRELQCECATLTRLDGRYGNGRVNPSEKKTEATAVTTNPPRRKSPRPSVALEAKTLAKPTVVGSRQATKGKRPLQLCLKSGDKDVETCPPTNDELLEKIDAVKKTLQSMRNAGVPLDDDAHKALKELGVLAVANRLYFRSPKGQAA
jgi:hypothetical protein